jgi:hypothetical protein
MPISNAMPMRDCEIWTIDDEKKNQTTTTQNNKSRLKMERCFFFVASIIMNVIDLISNDL